MSRLTRVALGVAAILQALGCVACILLAIWGGDDRWGSTAFVLSVTFAATAGVAMYPGSD